MPAHKHCDLFVPVGWPLWVGNGPGQFLGSYVINWVRTARLVQWLSWVFKNQERNKPINKLLGSVSGVVDSVTNKPKNSLNRHPKKKERKLTYLTKTKTLVS